MKKVIWNRGLGSLTEQIPTAATSLPASFTPPALIGIFLTFLLGEALIPPYTVRALAAREPGDARKGFVLAALFGVAWFFVCVNLGVFIREAAPDEPSSGAFLYAMQHFLPPGLFALVLVAVIAIILSSWDSLLNCASTSFETDILSVVFPKSRDEQTAVTISMIINVLIGVGATVFAVSVPGIVERLLFCYTLWAPTIVLPLAIAVLKRDVYPASGLVAILCGGFATGIWEWALHQPFQIPSVAVGLSANQMAFWSTHFIMAICT